MPYLVPQLRSVAENYDGTKPLPAKLEKVARLLAGGELTQRAVAARCRISEDSVGRLNQQPAFVARRSHLARLAAERAAAESPLSYKGNRIAMLDQHARKLSEDLVDNDYTTTVGIDKGGNVIEGFDTNRVGQLTKLVMAIDAMTEGRRSSTIVEATHTTNNVVLTTDQVVTRVQALLSRTEQGQAPPGMPPAPGVGGGISETDTIDERRAVLDTEYKTISDAKGDEE